MKILIAGSRNWKDINKIKNILISLPVGTLVHGADTIAGMEAYKLGWKIKRYPANWNIGKSAGPIRNQQMIDEEHLLINRGNDIDEPIDYAYLFHENIANSKDTKHMLSLIVKCNITYQIIS